jgi:DUF1009 family protein
MNSNYIKIYIKMAQEATVSFTMSKHTTINDIKKIIYNFIGILLTEQVLSINILNESRNKQILKNIKHKNYFLFAVNNIINIKKRKEIRKCLPLK